MKKALLVVTRAELGGAQRVVLELAEQLIRDNYHVIVASGEKGWLLEMADAQKMAVHRFRYLKRSSNPLFAALFALELWNFARKSGERMVVHLNSSNALPGSVGARLAGMPVVFTVHGLSMLDQGYETNPLLRLAYRLWFKFWFGFVDHVVCVSAGNAKRLRELGVRSDADVIPNGIDEGKIAFATREQGRLRLGLEDETPLVMTIGRLEYSKRQDLLLDAWRDVLVRLPLARLMLIGEGPERDALMRQAHRLGISERVIFAGSDRTLVTLLPAADVFALPSRYEGWPIALLEALAAGTPIVASDVGGIREQVGRAGVLLARETNASDWANALVQLLEDKAQLMALSGMASERARKWGVAGMAGSYEALYEGRKA